MAPLPQAHVIPLMLSDCLSTDSSLEDKIKSLSGNILSDLNSNRATAKMAEKMSNQESEALDTEKTSEKA